MHIDCQFGHERPSVSLCAARRYLIRYLEFVREHRRLYRTALDNAEALQLDGVYDRMYEEVIAPILDRYGVPARDRRYIMAFYINGLVAIMSEWLKNDCADSVEHIAKLMQQCLPETAAAAVKAG